MSPEDALKQLCSVTPLSPKIEDYNQDVSHIDFDAIYDALSGNDLDAFGAIISYLNSYTAFTDAESSNKLLSNAAYLCRLWMNPVDQGFAEGITPVVGEILKSAQAVDSWMSEKPDRELLNASWFFNLVVLLDTHVYDLDLSIAKMFDEEDGVTSYYHTFNKIFELALQNKWSVTALMAVNRFVSHYSIDSMDNSMFDKYVHVLEYEEWLVNAASKVSIDMEATTAWFFYILKSNVLSRSPQTACVLAKQDAASFYEVARSIPTRSGYHSRDYRYLSKMDIAPVIEHILQFWVGQGTFGAAVTFEQVQVGSQDGSNFDKIYKSSFAGKSNFCLWARELIVSGLHERFGCDMVTWNKGYVIADRKLIIVSEFDELTVSKELLSGNVESFGFVRAGSDGAYPHADIIEIASVSFSSSDSSEIHKLLVGSLKPILDSNYRGLLSTGRGYLLNCDVDGVGNIASLTKCDTDSIQLICRESSL